MPQAKMTAPKRPNGFFALATVIGGFVALCVLATIDGRLATFVAVGAVVFAVASMILAILRKH